MKTLLINPPYQSLYRAVRFQTPPLGLLYVAAFCERDGWPVDLHDMNVGSTVDQDPDFRGYDVVGITAETSRIKPALRLARLAKRAGARVVIGGPHAMFDADAIFKTGDVDVIISGEGELTFLELMERYRDGAPVHDVRGILYPGPIGRPVRTPGRPYPDDVDAYPFPARHLLHADHHKSWTLGGRRVVSILSSRGCPYDCTFCSSAQFTGRGWRPRSPRSVVDEIEHCVKRYGYEGAVFVDDNFTLDPDRVIGICDEILARKLDVRFWALTRTDTIAHNEELVKKMAEAGAFSFLLGIESPHQEVLDAFKKKSESTFADESVALLKKHGIDSHASFIIGNLDESREMILETIRYARRLNPESAQFSILTPFPGTQLYNENRDRIFEKDWDRYDTVHAVMAIDKVSPVEMEGLLRRAYASFWLRPSKLWKGLFSRVRGKGLKVGAIFRMLRALRENSLSERGYDPTARPAVVVPEAEVRAA
ncbi:MAG: radical SAM protein [Acidobacteriota bacterium]